MTTEHATSQNGWPVLGPQTLGPLPRLRDYAIAGTHEHVKLRDGSAGFVLLHMADWWRTEVEPIGGALLDDWGWAVRPIRGTTTGYSNHASGTALDINATQHPRGVPLSRTFTPAQVAAIRHRLHRYGGAIRWGGDYVNSPVDGMHLELVQPLAEVEGVARRLLGTTRGKRVLDANPGLRAVILS